MRRIERLIGGRAEVVAAILAVLVLLVLTFGLHTNIIVSAVVALLVFGGAYIALHRPGALERCEAKIAQTERLAEQLRRAGANSAAGHIRDVTEQERRVLATINGEPDRADAAELFLISFLNPYYDVLTTYARLAQVSLDNVRQEVTQTESVTIPAMLDNLKRYQEKLLTDDMIDLQVAREMANLSS